VQIILYGLYKEKQPPFKTDGWQFLGYFLIRGALPGIVNLLARKTAFFGEKEFRQNTTLSCILKQYLLMFTPGSSREYTFAEEERLGKNQGASIRR